MARSRKSPSSPGRPTIAPEKALQALTIQLERGEALIREPNWTESQLDDWSLQAETWLREAFGENASELQRFQNIGDEVWLVGMGDSLEERRMNALKYHRRRLDLLSSLKQIFEDQLELQGAPSAAPLQEHREANPKRLRSVFVVHGHDNEMRAEVSRFIEKLGMDAIVLFERLNRGRTIIEKLEQEAGGAAYAVVLVSPDDLGGKAIEQLENRPRQNVVFELGFFIGKLGRESVCVLKRGEVELLSDVHGLVYVDYETDWRVALVREMKAAGMEGNWAAVFD